MLPFPLVPATWITFRLLTSLSCNRINSSSTFDQGVAMVPNTLRLATIPSSRPDSVFHEKSELRLRSAFHRLGGLHLNQECPLASPLGALFLTVVTHSRACEIQNLPRKRTGHLISSLHPAFPYWFRQEMFGSELCTTNMKARFFGLN